MKSSNKRDKIVPGQKDITNLRFGMLTARYCTGKRDAQGYYYWHCACDCGEEIDASLHRLHAGYRKNCGCIKANIYKDNLKLIAGTSVTVSERVRGKPNSANVSGYTGVYQNKNNNGKWCAQIGFQSKTYYLGTYDKKEAAVKARKCAEKCMKNLSIGIIMFTYPRKSRITYRCNI